MASRFPRVRKFLTWSVVTGVVGLVAAGVPCAMVAKQWAADGVVLADAHARYEQSHPGWSFPARLQTAAIPVSHPDAALLPEAVARGYAEDCKDPGPGEYCRRTKTVVPRSGDSLEPIELGWVIGPDAEIRVHLPVDDAPQVLLDAIVAGEDRDFMSHGGVNWPAMARALLVNAQSGGYAQGASTLTMQVVRNLSQQKEKTAARKVREMVLAMALDAHLGKRGVLQMYLDAPYLGQWGNLSICGFEAAAKHYFRKHASELTLSEAATLVGILPAPGRFSPDTHSAAARERRDHVLRAMQEVFGYDVAAALKEPIVTFPPEDLPDRVPSYYSAARAWLEQNVNTAVLYGSGLVVTVGLDVHAQTEAESMFPAKMKYFEGLIGQKRPDAHLESAGVLLDVDTGLIRGVYGGSGASAVTFNRATQAMRQPGSSFKPLVYAMAFEEKNADGTQRFTALSTEPNSPRVFKTPLGDWSPRNVGGEYSPTACLAQGLAWSQNIATASLLEEMGGTVEAPKKLIAFAQKLGFDSSKFPAEMGLALGQGEVTPLQMGQFAATVSNGGLKVVGTPVLHAEDAAGKTRISPPVAGDRVLSAEAAALTRELMRLVIDTGTGGAARGAGGEAGYPGPAMGKTGTTDKERDLWFVGATPRYAMAVWVGYDVPTPLGVAASDLAAPLWGWWMRRVTKDEGPSPEWPNTPEISHRYVCTVSGKAGNGTCRGISAPFIAGTDVKGGCSIAHPPPEPETEELDADGKPIAHGHESIWKRLAREKLEADGAVVPATVPPSPAGDDPLE